MPQAFRFDDIVAVEPSDKTGPSMNDLNAKRMAGPRPVASTARRLDDVVAADPDSAPDPALSSRLSFEDVVAVHPGESAERPGLLRRIWDRANAPLLPQIAEGARSLSERIASPSRAGQLFDVATALATRSRPGEARGFVAGAIEGAGDVAASRTSPANLALTAASAGAAGAGRAGLTNVSRALHGVEAAAGGAYAAEGAHTIATAPDAAGKLMGVAEVAGGAAGVMHGGRGARGRTPITGQAQPPASAGPVRLSADDVASVTPAEVAPPTRRASSAEVSADAAHVAPDASTIAATSEAPKEAGTRLSFDDLAAIEPVESTPRLVPDAGSMPTPDGMATAHQAPVDAPAVAATRTSLDDVVAIEPPDVNPPVRALDSVEPVSPTTSTSRAAGSPDIHELHAGIGAVGRVSRVERIPLEAASTTEPRRAVRTIDPTTVDQPTPPAKPMGEHQRLEGIKLDAFDDTVRPALREVLESNEGFADQRRDVQTWERTQHLSQEIAVDISDSLPKGRVLNAEETTAFANTLATLTDRVTSLAARAARGELDEIGRLGLEEARLAQVAVTKSLWGTVTEQGRALNAWKATKRVLESHDAAFIKQALRFVKDDGTALAPLLEQLGGDPVKQYRWLKNETGKRRSVADTLSSYYYANILSGPATHERNIISNSANLLFGLAADVGTGRIGHTRANLAGMWNALSKADPRQGPYALALPRAFKEVYFHLTHGFSPTDIQTGKVDFGRIQPEFVGGGTNPFNWPSRALNAGDGFFRALVNQGERYRAAYAIAKEGTEGTLDQRMAEALNDLPIKVVREIDEMTTRAVFQETPGAVTQAFLKLRETVPGMRYVVPFVRIVANLTRQGFEASPAGFAMKSARQPGRLGEAARAKAALGSVALLPVAYYAATERITGNGPSDPGERQAWLASGKRPNSILNPVTGEWVNYMSWQPIALPMSIVANAVEAYRDGEGRRPRRTSGTPLTGLDHSTTGDPDAMDAWTEMAMQAVMRTANSVLQQSFLSGMSSLVEAMNDPERSAKRFFTRLAQGFVPLSSAMRTATQVVDPVVRTPQTVREGVQAVIPGQSHTLAPLVDRFGAETEGTGHPLTRGVYQASPTKADSLQPLLDHADVQPVRPSKTLRDETGPVALSRSEETALQKARGQIRRAAYERVQRRYGANWQRVPAERLQDELTQSASQALADLTAHAKRLKRAGRTLTVDDLLAPARGRQ